MIYALIILVLLGTVLNSLSKKYSFTNLTYKREISKRVIEIGEKTHVSSIIENKKWLPVTFLRIQEKLPAAFEYEYKDDNTLEVNDNKYHEFSISIMPYQRIKRTYTATCMKRGNYILNDIILSAGDIIGLNQFTMEKILIQHVIVLPKTYDIENNLVNYGDFMGNISVKRWIINDPIISIGIRDYTGFEPQNTIHWASSLRMNKLMVKQFDFTTDTKLMIIINVESNKPFWMNIDGEKIEKCISIARGIAEKCEEMGIQYGMITNAQVSTQSGKVTRVFPGWGRNHLSKFLETLGCMQYGVGNTFEETIQSVMMDKNKNTTNIIITPRILEEYIEPINLLSKYSGQMVLIPIDEENLDRIDSKIQSIVEKRS